MEAPVDAREERWKKGRTLRTLSYFGGTIGLLIFKFLIFSVLVNGHWDFLSEILTVKYDVTDTWETANSVSGLFGSLFPPLFTIVPPMLKWERSRAWARILLGILSIIFFSIHGLTTVGWCFIVTWTRAKRVGLVVVLYLLIDGMMIWSYVLQLVIDTRLLKRGNSGEDKKRHNNTWGYEYQISIFIGALAIFSMEDGLYGLYGGPDHYNEEENTPEMARKSPWTIKLVISVPLFLMFWLFIVYQQHYARSHTGWYTFHRCRERVEDCIEEVTLTEIELARRKKKRLGLKVIEGMFATRLINKNCCPC